MLFISLEQETHNSKAWQGGGEVGGGRRKERMKPQPLSEKLTLRPEPRVGVGIEERKEEAGDKRGTNPPWQPRPPLQTAALLPRGAACERAEA